jgi:hypothetical protein
MGVVGIATLLCLSFLPKEFGYILLGRVLTYQLFLGSVLLCDTTLVETRRVAFGDGLDVMGVTGKQANIPSVVSTHLNGTARRSDTAPVSWGVMSRQSSYCTDRRAKPIQNKFRTIWNEPPGISTRCFQPLLPQ